MKTQTIIVTLILTVLLLPRICFAFETDQYDLPRKPLADIGSEVTDHVALKIEIAVDKVNAGIVKSEKCLREATGGGGGEGCGSRSDELRKLEYLRSGDAIAREVFEQLGNGLPPFTAMGTWMDSHRFVAQPARYRTSYFKSIFILNPGIALTISPTVNLYGSEFGTDKIAHIFQQGFTYYKIYQGALVEGATPAAARARALRWGQKSERTFYGTLVAGVYSNGDLSANYAGLKFYQGLTKPTVIGVNVRPATLELDGGAWRFTDNWKDTLLKPFISDHLNEALNPSIFTNFLGWRSFIRRAVRRRSCEQWRQRYPGLSKRTLEEKSRSLRIWFGEDYGFTDSEDFVTIANTCFENEQR